MTPSSSPLSYLLDTHALAWAVGAPDLLSDPARAILRDPAHLLLVSAASIWEMSIKHHLGKWPEAAPFLDEQMYASFLKSLRAQELSIRAAHARLAGQWNLAHRDPFDRLLASQAVLEGVALLSRDAALDQFPVRRIW
ncbi:type II toxin-antitoxin system VapC family toxin [Deinococcus sp.]|uniref:type II toxin-antitoxin system VapC family toxin n=1 Tax=Deinococcus sp. TaxID=47478 RepID=UPI003CC63BCA